MQFSDVQHPKKHKIVILKIPIRMVNTAQTGWEKIDFIARDRVSY